METVSSATAHCRRALLLGAGALLAASRARAAGYPERPVRIVAPFAPGGPSDIMARLLAAKLSEVLGASFFVENRAGAGSNIGTAVAARAAPDGYTLLLSSSAFVVNPGLYKRVPYDPVGDFTPLAELVTSPNMFVANKASGITSLRQLVDLARSRPGTVDFASAGIGTTPHLAGEMLNIAAGIQMTHVPFNGAGPAMQALLGGTVPVACAALPGARPGIGNGDIVALATTGATRWYDLPDVPTMVGLGYPGFVSDTFHGCWAPAGTPPDIAGRLTRAMLDSMRQPAFHEQLRSLGFEVIGNGPDGLTRRVETEVPMYRELIAKAGIPQV